MMIIHDNLVGGLEYGFYIVIIYYNITYITIISNTEDDDNPLDSGEPRNPIFDRHWQHWQHWQWQFQHGLGDRH